MHLKPKIWICLFSSIFYSRYIFEHFKLSTTKLNVVGTLTYAILYILHVLTHLQHGYHSINDNVLALSASLAWSMLQKDDLTRKYPARLKHKLFHVWQAISVWLAGISWCYMPLCSVASCFNMFLVLQSTKKGNAWGDCMLNANGISMFEGISPLSDYNIR